MRYLIFAGLQHEANGGINDLKSKANTLKTAQEALKTTMEALKSFPDKKWSHIYDTKTGKIITS